MTNSSKELVFQDVRKSYRFLYQYQRRVMDLITFISNHWSFTFEKGEPIFCGPPPLRKINPSGINWAWDFLAFYNFNFVYHPKNFNDFKGVKLMLNIVSDTGFYDNENDDPLNIPNFGLVDKAKTQLHIILKTKNINWDSYKEKQYSANQINNEYVQIPIENQIVIGKKVDLLELMNEDDVLQELEKFEVFCGKNGISLKPNAAKIDK